MRRLLLLSLCLLGTLAFATPDAPGESHFRLGPFFEYGSRNGELSRFAIRPFYAWERSKIHDGDYDMEVLWPLSHFGWRDEEFHWRVLMTFWQEADRTNQRSRDYSLAIPPIWFHGRDQDKDYWGLFPIYGQLPKLALVEDFRWTLFPFYVSYRTGGSRAIRRQYFVWPFFSLKHDPDKTRWALWPIYGTKHEPDFDARFILWPFWNDQTFHAPNHKGSAWMLWPIVERIDADTEQGWGVLPPLFRHTVTTSGANLWRCPWPLFERYTDPRESTWRFWRFWGMTHRGSRSGWWFLYPITVKQEQKTVNVYNRTFRIWPFYTHDVSYGYDTEGKPHLQNSYFRIWPFYSSTYNTREGLRRRTLELCPIRDVPAIERNWSPFWTFYTATQEPGSDEVLHELFWGLIWWHTTPGDYAEEHSTPEED